MAAWPGTNPHRGAPADVQSDSRLIEVKAAGRSARGYDQYWEHSAAQRREWFEGFWRGAFGLRPAVSRDMSVVTALRGFLPASGGHTARRRVQGVVTSPLRIGTGHEGDGYPGTSVRRGRVTEVSRAVATTSVLAWNRPSSP